MLFLNILAKNPLKNSVFHSLQMQFYNGTETLSKILACHVCNISNLHAICHTHFDVDNVH